MFSSVQWNCTAHSKLKYDFVSMKEHSLVLFARRILSNPISRMSFSIHRDFYRNRIVASELSFQNRLNTHTNALNAHTQTLCMVCLESKTIQTLNIHRIPFSFPFLFLSFPFSSFPFRHKNQIAKWIWHGITHLKIATQENQYHHFRAAEKRVHIS